MIIRAESLKSQAYNLIRELISEGKVDQKEIYSEQMLADKFNISRTPIREALLQLKSEGLIETLPNRGFILKKMTYYDAYTIFQMRAAIEGYCSSLLANSLHLDEARKTIERVQYLLDAAHADFNREEEMEFHIEIIRFSSNTEFLKQFNNMRAKIDLFWDEVIVNENRQEEAYQEHKLILDAIRRGNPELAYKASTEHLAITLEKIGNSRIFDDPGKCITQYKIRNLDLE